MEVYRRSSWLLLLLGVTFLAAALQGVQGEAESEGPSESECRPYIEKALKELATEDNADHPEAPGMQDSTEDIPTVEITTDDSDHQDSDGDDDTQHEGKESAENLEQNEDSEQTTTNSKETTDKSQEDDKEIEDDSNVSKEHTGEESVEDAHDETKSEEEVEEIRSIEDDTTEVSNEEPADSKEDIKSAENEPISAEDTDKDEKSAETDPQSNEDAVRSIEDEAKSEEQKEEDEETKSTEDVKSAEGEQHSTEDKENSEEQEAKSTDEEKEVQSADEEDVKSTEEETKSIEEETKDEESDLKSEEEEEKANEMEDKTAEVDTSGPEGDTVSDEKSEEKTEGGEKQDSGEDTDRSVEQADEGKSVEENAKSGEKDITEEAASTEAVSTETTEKDTSGEEKGDNREKRETADTITAGATASGEESETTSEEKGPKETEEDEGNGSKEETSTEKEQSDEPVPEEELTNEIDIPTDLRPRDHIDQLLKLDEESSKTEKIINRIADITLRDLKRVYENAIKPLEVLYKYRDLSNRHFGDAEIFSKPLVLFMGPWSGGKSSIINYLVDNEYNETSLRTGAEPSPAYFNILMYGDEPEVLDGTQLAADFTFSGLQKFGQGLEERLRGLKLPRKLLEKINLVEIPGILEVRKQVSRVFPFNDACQWFIDRADIIFLVYDPSKLDVGPETEAILDQLKGREHQTRIILNKADQVKPEELMRVQGALIWNISPLMSSAQPPVMYTTSLWTRPYEIWAPVRLLQAQERAFLRDLRSAIDKRIDNKIASARRFAVRVRNHAKMVDCYLTTYYNHKSVFGNKKQVSDEIIEHPQDYHIYEGISTLTNISRYDLPDPDVYRDFFKLNPLYDFQQLSATCTYFRGCPINRLDVAIAYDLPELVGKHKRLVESALTEANLSQTPGS